jgi:dienelactone hydrolase
VVRRTAAVATAALTLALTGACGDADDTDDDTAGGRAPVTAERCRVDLHGKGGDGAPARLDGDVAVLSPTGNGEGWGGREWRYASDDELAAAIAAVRTAIDDAGCERVAIHGFSNGAAAAAAMLCSGETFDGRLVGVLVDDPVTDDATAGCARPDDLPVDVLWTGALDEAAPPGTACADVDWTCAGATVRGIDAFAADLDATVTPSPHREHRRHDAAPQPAAWLAG